MNVKLPPLEEYQKVLFETYNKHPKGKQIVVKAVRQCGKSVALEVLLVYASLSEADSVSLSVSPTLAQSRKMFNDITKMAEKLITKANGTLLTIEFINGSSVKFGSCEQGDSLRGFTIKRHGILCLDEAAFVDKDFFYEVLLPTTNVYRSDIFICSTPKFKQGLFYELFVKGQDEEIDNVVSIDWTDYDTSKYLSPETLEIYRKQLPKAAFEAEFLGQFIDADGMVFADFKKCICDMPLINDGEQLIVSVDWAAGLGGNNDDTAITIGKVQDGRVVVGEVKYFNNKQTQGTIDEILDLVNKYVKLGYTDIQIVVEKNSIGNIYLPLLREEIDAYSEENSRIYRELSLCVNTFITTNTSKNNAVQELANLFEKDLILIPNNKKLVNELSMFECKTKENGTITYNAPIGAHDDAVMSLCFLVSKLYSQVKC